jgi:hypothetical protein
MLLLYRCPCEGVCALSHTNQYCNSGTSQRRDLSWSALDIVKDFSLHMCATTLMYAHEASSLGTPFERKKHL